MAPAQYIYDAANDVIRTYFGDLLIQAKDKTVIQTRFVDFYGYSEVAADHISICCTRLPYFTQWEFTLSAFPGNCGVVVSSNTWIRETLRGKGLGQKLRRLKDEICREAGFTTMQCTSIANNAVQNHILQKDGFKEIYRFTNKRTGNTCIQWAKEL